MTKAMHELDALPDLAGLNPESAVQTSQRIRSDIRHQYSGSDLRNRMITKDFTSHFIVFYALRIPILVAEWVF